MNDPANDGTRTMRPATPRNPWTAVWLFASAVAFSWLTMMIVHECGHVLAAMFTGGSVDRLVLHPFAISRTDVSSTSWPLAVVWAGPAFGSAAPLLAYFLVRAWAPRYSYLAAFVAGFCCVANGAYIGSGTWNPVGDAAELLRLGSPPWSLGAFGACACVLSLVLWNGLAPRFGFGRDGDEPDSSAAVALTVAATLIIVVEATLSARM